MTVALLQSQENIFRFKFFFQIFILIYSICFLRSCLRIDPRERVTIREIIELLEANFVDLNSSCVPPRQPTPTQPSQPPLPVNHTPGSAQPSFSLHGFTKYIKDTSSKVMQTMQQ